MSFIFLLTFLVSIIFLGNCQHLMPLPANLKSRGRSPPQSLKPIHIMRKHNNTQYISAAINTTTSLLQVTQQNVVVHNKVVKGSMRCKGGGCNNFWSYKDGIFGPVNWHLYYPACGTGRLTEKQSPIDVTFPINEYYVDDPFIPNLIFSHKISDPYTLQLKNNGHTLQVGFPPHNGNLLSGGLFSESYSLAFFRFHWGANDGTGSEHHINGHQYPLELHFTYWKSKYNNIASSLLAKDELVVVAVLFDIGHDNAEIEVILQDTIPSLIKAKSERMLSQKLSVGKLFPSTAGAQWISYPGSLTTPPCAESVTWVVLKDTMPVSPDQLSRLRKLASDLRGTTPIEFNYRPLQLRNNRPLITSFEPVGKVSNGDTDFMLTLTKNAGCWSQTRSECQSQGGDLASIISKEEQQGVLTTCKRGGDGSNYCWIGLTRNIETVGTRNGWYWVDGTEGMGYTAWCCNEGVGCNQSQNYGVISNDSPTGSWHDEIDCPRGGLHGVCMIPIHVEKGKDKNKHQGNISISGTKDEYEQITYKWSYKGQNSPPSWPKTFPGCSSKTQSPIDVKFQNTAYYVLDETKPSLIFADEVDEHGSVILENNGHYLQLNYLESRCAHRLAGGPLLGTYNLARIDFHWGVNEKSGSEHFLNGRQYPLEVQFVYWNIKNENFKSSLNSPNGLAVVSVLFDVGNENPVFRDLFEGSLQELISGNLMTPNTKTFLINSLRPKTATTEWISYEGSMTSPPCSKSVTWIVLKDTMTVSISQLKGLRKLSADKAGLVPLHPNFRPLQSINDRVLTTSFKFASVPVFVPNWSFTKPGIPLKEPSNWYCGPGPCAVFENDGRHGNKISGASDPYLLFINSHTHTLLIQTVPTKYSADHAYVLTVAIAGRADNPGVPPEKVSLSISLCYSNINSCIGSTQVTYDQLSYFELRDFSYTTPILDPRDPARGKEIVIAIETVILGESGGDWTIDNIRLEQLAPAQLSRSRRILTMTSEPKCWSNARAECQSMGGDLVSIATEAEQWNVLAKCQNVANSDSCWIGLRREEEFLGTRLGWKWTDNTHSHFTNWCCGEEGIAHGDGENYGIIQNRGLGAWHDVHDCGIKRYGVCAIPRNFIYTLTRDRLYWSEAVHDCRKQGGHLASIVSEEEQSRVIAKCREANTGNNCWLGFRRNSTGAGLDPKVRAGWWWIDGTKNRGFHKWSPSEGFGCTDKRDYAVISVKSKFGLWHNRHDVGKKLYGVCIVPRVPEISPSYYIPCPKAELPTTPAPTKSPTTLAPTKSPTKSPTTLAPTTLAPTTSPTTSPTRSPTRSPTNSPTTLAPTKSPTLPTRSPTISLGCIVLPGYTAFADERHPRGDVVNFFSLTSCADNCRDGCIGFHWVHARFPGVCYHWSTEMSHIPTAENSCLYIKDQQPSKAESSTAKKPIKLSESSDITLTLTRNATNWYSARQDCLWQGGDLASITTPEEQSAALRKCQQIDNGNSCWIGLRRDGAQTGRDGWFWVDGTQDFRYQAWCCKEGFGTGDGQDFAIIKSGSNIIGEWHDLEPSPTPGLYGVCMIPHKVRYNTTFDFGYDYQFNDYQKSFSLLGNQSSKRRKIHIKSSSK